MPLFSLSPTFPQKVSTMFPDQTVNDVAGPYLLGLSTREARTKAGILSPRFWLRSVLQNFCLDT
jgi:hypothetical protein